MMNHMLSPSPQAVQGNQAGKQPQKHLVESNEQGILATEALVPECLETAIQRATASIHAKLMNRLSLVTCSLKRAQEPAKATRAASQQYHLACDDQRRCAVHHVCPDRTMGHGRPR